MPAIICIKALPKDIDEKWLQGLLSSLRKSGKEVGLIRSRPDEGSGMVICGGGLVLERPFDQAPGLMELAERYMAGLDLVISCAHPDDKKAKIAFLPEGAPEDLAQDPGVKAVVSPAPLEHPGTWFAPEDTQGLAQFVVQSMMPPKEPARVRVLLGGKRLPIKGFVQDIIANTNRGMVGSLRGGDKEGKLEIFID